MRPVAAPVTPRLEAESLTVRAGPRHVVDALAHAWTPGAVSWVRGPNGAGKSALLAVLAGVARPAGGHVRLVATGGRRPVAYYHPAMGLPPEPIARDWHALMRSWGLGGSDAGPLRPARLDARTPLGRVSTGEEKRLILDATLARAADLVVLDEPFGHLSRTARKRLARRLERIARASVVIVASHEPPPDGSVQAEVLTLHRASYA